MSPIFKTNSETIKEAKTQAYGPAMKACAAAGITFFDLNLSGMYEILTAKMNFGEKTQIF